MLNLDEITKHTNQLEAIFKDENEGKHVELCTSHSVYRSGTIKFAFDIHIKEFRLTTDRNNDLSLLVFIECLNATLKNDNFNTNYSLPELPMIEYYENLTNEKPGQFTIINKNDIMLSQANYEALGEKWRAINDRQVDRIFDYFEDSLNENSNYNINLSKLVFKDEIQAREKEQLRKEQAELKKQKLQETKDKVTKTAGEIAVGTAIAGAVATATIFAPVTLIISLAGLLSYCVVNLADTK